MCRYNRHRTKRKYDNDSSQMVKELNMTKLFCSNSNFPKRRRRRRRRKRKGKGRRTTQAYRRRSFVYIFHVPRTAFVPYVTFFSYFLCASVCMCVRACLDVRFVPYRRACESRLCKCARRAAKVRYCCLVLSQLPLMLTVTTEISWRGVSRWR